MIFVRDAYAVPELGRLMGISRFRALRLLKRMQVPVQPGNPGMVRRADLETIAPSVWASLEDAAHLRKRGR